jgi:predicted Rossmann fold flavoprotein
LHIYDVAAVGAGPAGIMAAIRAAELGKNVALIERNSCIGKKIMLSGAGRCNITNTCGMDGFLEAFGLNGKFYRSAFSAFFNNDLMNFFESKGLSLKVEDKGRVFPVTDMAISVVSILQDCLIKHKVNIIYKTRIISIEKNKDYFKISSEGKDSIYASSLILTTGGLTYAATGSSGDGFAIAKKFGHTVTKMVPALVPLKVKEKWISQLQGISLEGVRLTFRLAKKKVLSGVGDILFTHFGISGPLVLDMSNKIASLLFEHKEILLGIDIKPEVAVSNMEGTLLEEFNSGKNLQLKNFMKTYLPRKAVISYLESASLDPEKKINQITKDERKAILGLIKSFTLTVTGFLSVDSAMVTGGGISTKEINPKTMGSRLVGGLYFAGEIIDGCALSGGYNMQQAFSTGFLAGEASAHG